MVMELNDALIPHYKCVEIPIHKLKTQIKLSESYLKEKPTWYIVDGKLQYFKVRCDLRLFTEQFFSKFGHDVLGLNTLDYKIASVRAFPEGDPLGAGETKIGLLSENFQDDRYNYYLVNELLGSEISNLVCYGYSLEGMLEYFKSILAKEDFGKCKDFLIRLFIADSFTMQMDRNDYNIGFQIKKVDGINYKQRLRPEAIKKVGQAKELLVEEDGVTKIKGFTPSKVYDNERILGVDHKNMLIYNSGDVWTPIWPYRQDLLFTSQEQARKAMEEDYMGLDPNLFELYCNHPECKEILERLAYDDEYKKVLEEFENPHSQVALRRSTQEYFENLMEERRGVIKKVLSF